MLISRTPALGSYGKLGFTSNPQKHNQNIFFSAKPDKGKGKAGSSTESSHQTSRATIITGSTINAVKSVTRKLFGKSDISLITRNIKTQLGNKTSSDKAIAFYDAIYNETLNMDIWYKKATEEGGMKKYLKLEKAIAKLAAKEKIEWIPPSKKKEDKGFLHAHPTFSAFSVSSVQNEAGGWEELAPLHLHPDDTEDSIKPSSTTSLKSNKSSTSTWVGIQGVVAEYDTPPSPFRAFVTGSGVDEAKRESRAIPSSHVEPHSLSSSSQNSTISLPRPSSTVFKQTRQGRISKTRNSVPEARIGGGDEQPSMPKHLAGC